MAIEGIGATVTFAAASVGQVVSFDIPDDESKEYEVTSLSDTREQFKISAMSVGQEFTMSIRLDPESPQITKGSSGEYVVTMPKQTSSSTTQRSYTFTAFNRVLTGGTADVGSTEGIVQTVTARLTTEVVVVDES